MKLNINIYLTTSKFAAYLILIIGSVYSYIFQDASTLIATFSAVSAVLMLKTYTQSKTYKSEYESDNYDNKDYHNYTDVKKYKKNKDEIG